MQIIVTLITVSVGFWRWILVYCCEKHVRTVWELLCRIHRYSPPVKVAVYNTRLNMVVVFSSNIPNEEL